MAPCTAYRVCGVAMGEGDPSEGRQLARAGTRASVSARVIDRLLPGVRRVQDTVEPFAQEWRAVNARALESRSGDPLWVVLGDSMSQGIGAASIWGGWVGQLVERYRAAGTTLRILNLSVTGARVADVLRRQVPELADLGVEPALVTLLAGANDMLTRKRQRAAVPLMEQLLQQLPAGRSVVATLPRRNQGALAINALVDDAASTGAVRVADTRGKTLRSLIGARADDHFHPNERGYQELASTFERAIEHPFSLLRPAHETS